MHEVTWNELEALWMDAHSEVLEAAEAPWGESLWRAPQAEPDGPVRSEPEEAAR